MNPDASENPQKTISTALTNRKRVRFLLTSYDFCIEQDVEPLDVKGIRSHVAEFIGVNFLHAILTSRYPPAILDNDLFLSMNETLRGFLKQNWHTFDLFKPEFRFENDGRFSFTGVSKLYEVKSRIITEDNRHEMIQPTFRFSMNQKRFFEKCAEAEIDVKIFAVFFLPNWEVEVAQFDYSEVKKEYTPPDPRHEEKMKRIVASPLSRFFNELYPDMVLEKIEESELNERYDQEAYEFASMMAKNPDERVKKILEARQERVSYHKGTQRQKESKKRDVKHPSNQFVDAPDGTHGMVLSRHGQPWSIEEERRLQNEFEAGKSIIEICDSHQRSLGGILSKLRHLHIISSAKAGELYYELIRKTSPP